MCPHTLYAHSAAAKSASELPSMAVKRAGQVEVSTGTVARLGSFLPFTGTNDRCYRPSRGGQMSALVRI